MHSDMSGQTLRIDDDSFATLTREEILEYRASSSQPEYPVSPEASRPPIRELSPQEILDANTERKRCLGTAGMKLMFGPLKEKKTDREDREQKARDMCRTCSLRGPCLELALSVTPQFGFQGGKTAPERKAILKARRQVGTL